MKKKNKILFVFSLFTFFIISIAFSTNKITIDYNSNIPLEPNESEEEQNTPETQYCSVVFKDKDKTVLYTNEEVVCGTPITYEGPTLGDNDNEFVGWYKDEDYNEPFDLSSNVDENLELFAKYNPINRIELTSTVTSINYGSVYADFGNDISKTLKIKNTGNVSLTLDISNPTNDGPFGSLSFPVGETLTPGEEKEITLIARAGGTYHDTPGTYNGNYVITGTAESNESISITIPATITINPKHVEVSYTTHVQNIGWQNYVSNGEMAGTSGRALRLEGIKIKLVDQPYSGNIEYKTHIQNIGWELAYKRNNDISGTVGLSYRLEAIQIRLTGEMAEHYDVYYRVHAQNFGWLGWARNGDPSGTAGYAYRLEGIEIKLVEKGTKVPGYGETEIFVDSSTGKVMPVGDDKLVSYTTHVQNIGWQNYVTDGQMAGTSGRALRLEGIKIKLVNQQYSGNIEYKTHIQNIGWELAYKRNNDISGTVGLSYRLEAIQIRLTGEMAEHYDVYYRVHAQNFGWLGWARNGEPSGTSGYAYRLEGIEIKLVEKGTKVDGYGDKEIFVDSSTGKVIPTGDDKLITYSTHVQDIGWQNYVTDGQMAGTSSRGLRVEGIKIKLINQKYAGDIEYKSYIQNLGWESSFRNNGEVSGTLGRAYRLEAIQIRLTGEMAEHYDVYYRVHAQNFGWLGWAKNGEEAGTEGYAYRLEAIEIKLVNKNDYVNCGGSSYIRNDRFETDSNGNTRFIFSDGSYANDWITINGTKYFFNSLGVMIAQNARKVIDVSYHDGDIDWAKAVQQGGVDGAMIRVAYRGNTVGALVNDTMYSQNIQRALKQNIPIGVYVFSQAITVDEAREEARRAITIVESMGGKSKITLPITIDTEYTGKMENGVRTGRADNLTKQQRTDIVLAFLDEVEKAGYDSMIYASTNFYYEELDMNRIGNKRLWIAQYNHYCTYKGPGTKIMWQYSSTERIPGISTNVDVNVWF